MKGMVTIKPLVAIETELQPETISGDGDPKEGYAWVKLPPSWCGKKVIIVLK